MMRFQTVSPDCSNLSNVKRSISKPPPTMCKQDNNSSNLHVENGRATLKDTNTSTTYRFKSPSRTQDPTNIQSHSASGGFPNSPPQTRADSEKRDGSPNRGDVLLQWGPKKRARVSRSEVRAVTDDSSSSSSIQGKQLMSNKVQRRNIHAPMPPPPPAPSHSRSSNLRNGSLSCKENPGFVGNRNLDDLSTTANGSPSGIGRSVARSSVGKGSPPSPENGDRKKSCSITAKDEKQNEPVGVIDRLNHVASSSVQSVKETGATNAASIGETEKVKVEWPKIHIALSRKEKDDDFLAMKGTKLPHRPKKRAKHIDRTLQYCFPGMWLSDLNKSRYEVREAKEKKSAKKQQRRRGLKGLENMESDSE